MTTASPTITQLGTQTRSARYAKGRDRERDRRRRNDSRAQTSGECGCAAAKTKSACQFQGGSSDFAWPREARGPRLRNRREQMDPLPSKSRIMTAPRGTAPACWTPSPQQRPSEPRAPALNPVADSAGRGTGARGTQVEPAGSVVSGKFVSRCVGYNACIKYVIRTYRYPCRRPHVPVPLTSGCTR